MAAPRRGLLQAWREDILLRLAVGIFVAVALSTAVYTTYAARTLRAEAEQQLKERAERLANVLSQALARPLFDINTAAVSSAVDAMQASGEVMMLRVKSPTGEELASYAVENIDPAASVRVQREIRYQDGRRTYPVGVLELAFSRHDVDVQLRRQISHTVVANLLLALAIVVSIFLVGRKVIRPFADIQQALEKLTWGEVDIELSGKGRSDQVGKLSDAVYSFRDTLTRLRQVEFELRELNSDLERKIGERTAEVTQSAQVARDSQKKLQAIVDTALDAVVRMDIHGRIVGWNSQAETIFGWTREEALGLPLESTIIPPRYRMDHRKGMQRYISTGKGAVLDRRVELHALHKDGREFPIDLAITRIRLDEQEAYEFCGFIRDISERREREQKLVHANVMAEAANIAKSEFLANMSHEIRTPMSAIIGMAYLALRTGLSPKQHDYVSKIHRAALSLLGIINDILDFSKIEAGRLDVEQVPFFLDDVLANVASVTSQRAADKQLEYLFHVPPVIPRHLVGDPLRLGQVLINLVNNAVKFTAHGELELACTRLPDRNPGKVMLRFSVRDTGIGMTEDQVARLFRAFSQANGSTSRQYGGTGLGLSISQRLVQLMGGLIRVDSAPEQGSTFQFDLEFALSGLPDHAPVMPEALNGARLLLVDDSQMALDILTESLQPLPVRVDTAVSGAQALAAITQADAAGDPYRIVLTDWQMPGMDGIALARKVREDGALTAHPAMVLVTAFGREEVQRGAETAGITGFLFKPIGQSALVDTLVALVAPQRANTGSARVQDEAMPGQRFAARVLLVEDNSVNQEIAAELMATLGICVDVAENGKAALERLHQAGPDAYSLVLMDLEMPEMDGHEATRQLRLDSDFDELPVVAMTAHVLPDIRERCLAEGMQDYISKPIEPERLYTVLTRWLVHAKLPQQGREMPPTAVLLNSPNSPGSSNSACGDAVLHIDGIDSERGLRHVAGNAELYVQLLDRFRLAQRHAAEDIDAALAQGDLALASRSAHTLRGVAGGVGATAVEQAAQVVELALQRMAAPTPSASLFAPLAALGGALAAVVAALDRHFDRAPPPPVDCHETDVPPAEALAQLRSLLAEYSGDSTDYFDSVRAQLATLLAAADIERLAAHMNNYEFEAASRMLAAASKEAEPS
ncbi:response regulator [Duganella sp. FT92W]|uniref:Sensory/regulatory protein RpfC n=1 Tax=Pseudoduganella rivuli TaxID=2666085 RepID=A0A7X2LUJ3_9BURK|nr:response regulator [Pseudoduganella rivuli]MRV73998.1 response regulator [Pseudoduganella rivuli]